MNICPHCNEEITCLRWSEKVIRTGTFFRENKHNITYDVDSLESVGEDEFVCPDCDEILFRAEEDAIEFLKGRGGKLA